MSLTAQQAAELADYLPDELVITDARTRLLCIAELLRILTDEQHRLSNADIRAILLARFGESCTPAENTVAADLRAIRASNALGLSVHITPSGAWCEQRRLTPANVRLLLNAVQSSRFLTMAQSSELQEALCELVSRHQEEDLLGEVHVDQRVRRSYQQVFDSCDRIARALRTNRKLAFTYTYAGFDGTSKPLAGDDGTVERIETPIALIFSDGNYYLESYTSTPWRHGISLMRSRVDRMINVRVTDEPAERSAEVRAAKRAVSKRITEGFEMVDGPSRIIFLRVRADATNVMFDRFGFGIKFGQLEGPMGEVSTTALTCVRIGQSFTFYRWLSASGNGIVIAEPPSELGLSTGPWKRMLKDVTRGDLLEDYHAMVEGYLAYLDRAQAPYQNL